MNALHIDAAFLGHGQRQGLRTFHDFFTYIEGELVGAHPSRNVARVEPGGWCGFLKREYSIPWRDYLASWWAGFGLAGMREHAPLVAAARRLGLGTS